MLLEQRFCLFGAFGADALERFGRIFPEQQVSCHDDISAFRRNVAGKLYARAEAGARRAHVLMPGPTRHSGTARTAGPGIQTHAPSLPVTSRHAPDTPAP